MIFLKIFNLAVLLQILEAQKILNFKSSGLYFQFLGKIKDFDDYMVIQLDQDLGLFYDLARAAQQQNLDFKKYCEHKKFSCDENFNKVEAQSKTIVEKINNIYELFGYRPEVLARQRSKRFAIGSFTESMKSPSLKSDPVKRRQKRYVFWSSWEKAENAHERIDIVNERVNNVGDSVDRAHDRIDYTNRRVGDVEDSIQYVKGRISEAISSSNKRFDRIDDKLNENEESLNFLKTQNIMIGQNLVNHENKINSAFESLASLFDFSEEAQKSINSIEFNLLYNRFIGNMTEIIKQGEHLEDCLRDFAKGQVCTSFITPAEVIDYMERDSRRSELLVAPAISDYQKISASFGGAGLLNPYRAELMLFIQIPLFKKESLSLYEVIEVPIIKNNSILRVENSASFCVISENKDQIYVMNDYHRFRKDSNLNLYYSEDNVHLRLTPTSLKDVCLFNIFKERNLENCKFYEVPQNLEIFHELAPGKFLFALRDRTKYTYDCGEKGNNWNADHFIEGTGVLTLGPNCEFTTEKTTLKTSMKVAESSNKDMFKFNIEKDVNDLFSSFKFKDFRPSEKLVVPFKGLKTIRSADDLIPQNNTIFYILFGTLTLIIIACVSVIIYILGKRKNQLFITEPTMSFTRES